MNQKPSLEIGQIVYILSDKAQAIVPAIVVEEVIVKKFDGNQVSWKVSIGPKNNNKVVDSSRINGEIYTSLEDVKNVLMERFTGFVNGLCSDTEKKVESWYGKQRRVEVESDTGKIDPESIVSSIEQRTNQQQAFRPMPSNSNQLTPKENERERLRNLLRVEDEEEEPDEIGVPKQAVKIQGPNGEDMVVNVKMPE